MTTYLDDDTYERRRRRRIGALITVGAVLIVAIDVTAAIQWATGARSATDSITTLVVTAAMVVTATWEFTHPFRLVCGPVVIGPAYAAGALMNRNDTTTENGHRPTTDEGDNDEQQN